MVYNKILNFYNNAFLLILSILCWKILFCSHKNLVLHQRICYCTYKVDHEVIKYGVELICVHSLPHTLLLFLVSSLILFFFFSFLSPLLYNIGYDALMRVRTYFADSRTSILRIHFGYKISRDWMHRSYNGRHTRSNSIVCIKGREYRLQCIIM